MSPATETATEDLATAETEAEPASPENAEAARLTHAHTEAD